MKQRIGLGILALLLSSHAVAAVAIAREFDCNFITFGAFIHDAHEGLGQCSNYYTGGSGPAGITSDVGVCSIGNGANINQGTYGGTVQCDRYAGCTVSGHMVCGSTDHVYSHTCSGVNSSAPPGSQVGTASIDPYRARCENLDGTGQWQAECQSGGWYAEMSK